MPGQPPPAVSEARRGEPQAEGLLPACPTRRRREKPQVTPTLVSSPIGEVGGEKRRSRESCPKPLEYVEEKWSVGIWVLLEEGRVTKSNIKGVVQLNTGELGVGDSYRTM